MLPHLIHDNDSRIRRSKSANSVKERRKHPLISEPLDPNSARVHAVIAAHRAMDRSRASTSDDLARSDSSASRQSNKPQQPQSSSSYSPAAQLRRQRSLLQATTPSLAASLPLPCGKNIPRGGSPAYIQASVAHEVENSFEGEPSSFRRLRKARSVLQPCQG